MFFFIVAYFYFPWVWLVLLLSAADGFANYCWITRETKKKTLEEIAATFGDRVMLPGERDDGKDDEDGDKPDSQRVEVAVPVKDDDWFALV